MIGSKPLTDGGETTTQVVLVVPIVIAILMIAVQAAVYFHTSNVAGAAASHGASAAAANGKSAVELVHNGREAALAIIADAGARVAEPPQVLLSSERATIEVRALVPKIVPYFPAIVRRVAIEPRERFLSESMR